jgi:putative membrane protein
VTQPRVELEGRLHPLAVLVIARRFLGASVLPVAVLLLSAGTKVLVPTLVVGLLVGVPLAILSWWRFRYRVDGRRLELQSGVVNRSVRTIPLDRVRGVIVTAPFLHRLLGLVRVDVEAAAGGGSQAELSLAAVSREEAETLREALLAGDRGKREEAAALEPLYRATPGLLALGGITDMRYLLAPAAVVGVVFNLADDLPGGIVERIADAAADRVPTDVAGIALAAAAGIALVFVAAAAGSLLVDWAFTLRDDGETLTADRGLLTRRVVLIDRDRIRGADVRDSPLRRPLRLASVTAIAAGLRRRNQGTVLAPVLRTDAVAPLLQAVDSDAPDPNGPLVTHPPVARTRRHVRALAVPLALLVLSVLLGPPWAVAGAVILVAVAFILALDRYRQLGHAFNGRRLALREGSLRRRWSELDPDGVVAFELSSSPGQRRAGVCTLTLHLGQGAGSRRALDVGAGQASALLGTVWPQHFEQLLVPVEGPAETEEPAR